MYSPSIYDERRNESRQTKPFRRLMVSEFAMQSLGQKFGGVDRYTLQVPCSARMNANDVSKSFYALESTERFLTKNDAFSPFISLRRVREQQAGKQAIE
jgi:hypothetical protein